MKKEDKNGGAPHKKAGGSNVNGSAANDAAMKAAGAFVNEASLKSDSLGSYTGKPKKGERPDQDADDL